jgi:hypothetical protein
MPTGILPGSGVAVFNMTSASPPTASAPGLVTRSALLILLTLLPYLMFVVGFKIQHGVALRFIVGPETMHHNGSGGDETSGRSRDGVRGSPSLLKHQEHGEDFEVNEGDKQTY